MKFVSFASAGLLTLGFAVGAHAADLVTNGGFEGAPPNVNESVNVGATTINGWTVVNGANSTTGGGKSIAWLTDGDYGFNTPFGASYLDLTGYSGSSGDSGVSQTIATNVGDTYTLNFYIGGYQGYGSNSVIVDIGAVSSLISDPMTSGITAGNTLWTLENVSFVATSASTSLSIIGNNSGQDFIGLDNVSVSGSAAGAVPETASWAMFIGGLGLVGGTMRRRRASVRFA